MSWIWYVLGALLIILLGAVLVAFFIWRPRARSAITGATEAIAAELHGRPPLLIAPAQCRSAQLRDGGSLTGLGVVALTEQAVLFSRGERVAILAREGLQAQVAGTRIDLVSQTPPGSLHLTMPDTSALAAHLCD